VIPPQLIRRELQRRPFKPFRLHMSDGTSYMVKHQDNCILGRSFLVIPIYSPGQEFPTSYDPLSILHATRLETLEFPEISDSGGAGDSPATAPAQ